MIRIVEKPYQPPPVRTVTEGDSLQIDVNLDQNDSRENTPKSLLDQITVLKDNRPIVNQPEIHKWFDGQQFKMELKNLALTDRGLYEIDIQGQRTTICLLEVLERQPEVFQLELDRTTFEEGETIRLACTFPQRPGPVSNWFKDGQPIRPNEDIQVIDENNTLTIIIRNARRTDSGVYEVRIGLVIARAPMIYVIPKQQPPASPAPVEIPVQNVREGDTVTLSVEGLQNNVRPQDIQLLKNGRPLGPNQRPKVTFSLSCLLSLADRHFFFRHRSNVKTTNFALHYKPWRWMIPRCTASRFRMTLIRWLRLRLNLVQQRSKRCNWNKTRSSSGTQ